jgi:hypothetical protein
LGVGLFVLLSVLLFAVSRLFGHRIFHQTERESRPPELPDHLKLILSRAGFEHLVK